MAQFRQERSPNVANVVCQKIAFLGIWYESTDILDSACGLSLISMTYQFKLKVESLLESNVGWGSHAERVPVDLRIYAQAKKSNWLLYELLGIAIVRFSNLLSPILAGSAAS